LLQKGQVPGTVTSFPIHLATNVSPLHGTTIGTPIYNGRMRHLDQDLVNDATHHSFPPYFSPQRSSWARDPFKSNQRRQCLATWSAHNGFSRHEHERSPNSHPTLSIPPKHDHDYSTPTTATSTTQNVTAALVTGEARGTSNLPLTRRRTATTTSSSWSNNQTKSLMSN